MSLIPVYGPNHDRKPVVDPSAPVPALTRVQASLKRQLMWASMAARSQALEASSRGDADMARDLNARSYALFEKATSK